MSELIYKQDAIDLVKEVCDAIMSGCDSHYDPETEDEVYNDILEVDAILKCNKEIRIALANLPSAESVKAYTKADYIMALHKEYGCTLTMAEEAHNKALEHLRSKARMKG